VSLIGNTQPNANAFTFDLADLFTAGDHFVMLQNQSVYAFTAATTVIPAGDKKYNLGTIILKADVTGLDDNTAQKFTTPLQYKSKGTESVLLEMWPTPRKSELRQQFDASTSAGMH
jgi:hypothetical protein